MQKFKFLSAIILMMFFCSALYAQDEDIGVEFEDDEDWDDYVFDWGVKDLFSKKNAFEKNLPTIEAEYGFSKPFYHDDVFKGSFDEVKVLDIRLGYTDFLRVKKNEDIMEYNYNYLSPIQHPDLSCQISFQEYLFQKQIQQKVQIP